MDVDARTLDRLERIDSLDRRGASAAELLAELRGLLGDVERASRACAGGAAEKVEIERRWSRA